MPGSVLSIDHQYGHGSAGTFGRLPVPEDSGIRWFGPGDGGHDGAVELDSPGGSPVTRVVSYYSPRSLLARR